MIQLRTSRLCLLQLDLNWMQRFAADSRQAGQQLEYYLKIPKSGRTEHPVTTYRYALSELGRIPPLAEHRRQWHLLWEIIAPGHRQRIGGILFKGPPDERGQVEIGYGIDPAFRGKGYASEAMEAAIQWAFANGAQTVIAKINPGNDASRRVLEKVGMRQYQTIGKMPCFRREKQRSFSVADSSQTSYTEK